MNQSVVGSEANDLLHQMREPTCTGGQVLPEMRSGCLCPVPARGSRRHSCAAGSASASVRAGQKAERLGAAAYHSWRSRADRRGRHRWGGVCRLQGQAAGDQRGAAKSRILAPSPGENKDASPAQNDNNDVGAILGNLGNMLGGGTDDGDPVESISNKDPVTPCAAAPFPAQNTARIPLLAGTVVTHAWGMKNGDVESRMSVDSTDPTSVSFSASTGEYKDDDDHDWKGSGSLHTVCNEDFASANTYATVTGTNEPKIVHGLTRLRLSDKSFQEVKSSGKTNLIYWDVVSTGDAVKPDHEGGLLTRVEPKDVAYPMIVNDERVNLPAIHLAGIMDSVGKDPRPKKDRPAHTEADVYVIDDPLDPLVLMLRLKDPVLHDGKFRIEVVKIEYKVAKPVNTRRESNSPSRSAR